MRHVVVVPSHYSSNNSCVCAHNTTLLQIDSKLWKRNSPSWKKQGVILYPLSFQYSKTTTIRGTKDKAKISYIKKLKWIWSSVQHRRFLESVGMTINKRGIYLRNWMNTMQNIRVSLKILILHYIHKMYILLNSVEK